MKTATTPGIARASSASIDTMRACAYDERTKCEVQHAVDREVVDELGATDEEIGVFDAPNRGSENRSGHGPTLPSGLCAGIPADRGSNGVAVTCRSRSSNR